MPDQTTRAILDALDDGLEVTLYGIPLDGEIALVLSRDLDDGRRLTTTRYVPRAELGCSTADHLPLELGEARRSIEEAPRP